MYEVWTTKHGFHVPVSMIAKFSNRNDIDNLFRELLKSEGDEDCPDFTIKNPDGSFDGGNRWFDFVSCKIR